MIVLINNDSFCLCKVPSFYSVKPLIHVSLHNCHLYITINIYFICISTGSKSRGTAPSHFERGSSSVARHVLKSLEQMKLIEKASGGYVRES